jgi:hypothetical protein
MSDLSEVECVALVELLTETVEASRYPLSPRIKTLNGILAKMEAPPPRPEPYPAPKASAQLSAALTRRRRR